MVEADAVFFEAPHRDIREAKAVARIAHGDPVLGGAGVFDHDAAESDERDPGFGDTQGFVVGARADPDDGAGRRGVDGGLDRAAGRNDRAE